MAGWLPIAFLGPPAPKGRKERPTIRQSQRVEDPLWAWVGTGSRNKGEEKAAWSTEKPDFQTILSSCGDCLIILNLNDGLFKKSVCGESKERVSFLINHQDSTQ